MKPFAIAGMQLDLSATHENVTQMGHRLEVLMSVYPWVQMVVFSELAPFGPLIQHARPLPNETEAAFQEMAKRYGIWLLPGSMFERVGELVYNTASMIDPRGDVVGRYRKLFPFKPYEAGVEAGTEFLVFPGSGQVKQRIEENDPRLGEESIAEVFRAAGGKIRESWCGPCFGQGPDALQPGHLPPLAENTCGGGQKVEPDPLVHGLIELFLLHERHSQVVG